MASVEGTINLGDHSYNPEVVSNILSSIIIALREGKTSDYLLRSIPGLLPEKSPLYVYSHYTAANPKLNAIQL